MKKALAKMAVEPQPEEPKIDRHTPSPPNIKAIGGSGVFYWDMMVAERVAMTMHPTDINGNDERKLLAGMATRAFAPKDAVEAMLASQAAALHFASMECLRRSVLPQQNADVASKLRKDAANSARAMVDMCEALDRRRGKGPQVVRVERVVVNEGGQAVVGNVHGASVPPPAPQLQAIGQGATSMPVVDADPVAVDEGEGV